MAKKPKLVIVDAHALIHRAFHALPPMTTANGIPTNAVYGFTTMLLKAITQLKPTHLVVAFDMKGPTFRHEQFQDYKAHRKAAPDELTVQFDMAREIAQAFSIPILEKQGFEADDVIGTVVSEVDGSANIVIVTGDMDALQLVDDSTSVLALKRGISDTVLYTPALVTESYGFAASFIPDYKGLAGDTSDNIPGVAGIGVKTAKDLVGTYGSLEAIFEHIADLSPRAARALQGNEDTAKMCRDLATMHRSVPIHFSLKDAEFGEYNRDAVKAIFMKFEFHRLLHKLQQDDTQEQQPTLLDGVKADSMPKNYRIISSREDQQELMRTLASAPIVAFDTETDGLGARKSPIIGMSFAIHDGASGYLAWYVPITPVDVGIWKDFFENPAIKKTGHNLKYDVEVLMQSNIRMRGIVFDSMIASYLLRPVIRAHGLDELAQEKLQHTTIPITALIGEGKNQKSMKDVPLHDIGRYACEDAEVSLRLYDVFLPEIIQEKLDGVLKDLELPLIEVLADMELTGIRVRLDVLSDMNTKITQRIHDIEKEIWLMAGQTFNVGSPTQLRSILFDTLNLPTVGIKKNQTGYSTAAQELEKLEGLHPIIDLLSEFRELSKLKSTYINALPSLVDPETGRVYSSFNQTIAATGRLSSSDPNLQNIPIRSDVGREIRQAFIARDGYMLVKADYSQLELRIAAHISQDEKLLAAFRAGEDIHRATAAWVFSVPTSEVTDDMRRQAKTLNFGVLYGMGAQSFARAAKISVEEARSFIERYRDQYRGITTCIEKTIDDARSDGYVETMFGRKRYIPEIHSTNPAVRASAERVAFNFPIQGAEADILKKAMIQMFELTHTKYPTSYLVLTVHDELVYEVPSDAAKLFAQDLKDVMEHVITLDAPLVAEVGVGPSWGDIQA